MSPIEIIELAEAAAKLVGVITNAVQTGKTVLSTNDAAKLKAILDPLHASNMAASAVLDAKLAAAAAE